MASAKADVAVIETVRCVDLKLTPGEAQALLIVLAARNSVNEKVFPTDSIYKALSSVLEKHQLREQLREYRLRDAKDRTVFSFSIHKDGE